MKLGNTQLKNFGIQNWESEYMIHVCPKPGKVYIYKTEIGQDAADSGLYPQKSVWTKLPNGSKCETARGYAVPWHRLAGIRFYNIPNDLLQAHKRVARASPSRKGRWAEWVFQEMRKRGLIDHDTSSIMVNDLGAQLRGIDIEIQAPTYQVKYDGPGGHKEFDGSGNLFLQTDECNPLGFH